MPDAFNEDAPCLIGRFNVRCRHAAVCQVDAEQFVAFLADHPEGGWGYIARKCEARIIVGLHSIFTLRDSAVPIKQPTLTRNQKIAGGAGIIGLVIAAALRAVYVNEGDYSNHAADRGGPTRYGITEKVARQWGYKGDMRSFPKSCDAQHPVCSDLIYTTSYIDRPGYRPMASIEPAVLFELVDSAVLHGTHRSSMWFQASLNAVCRSGLTLDGKVGPRTIAAYETCQQAQGPSNLCLKMLETMDGTQKRFFDRIVARNPSQKVFYRGWTTRRIGNVPRAKCADWTAHA